MLEKWDMQRVKLGILFMELPGHQDTFHPEAGT
jgi:hypothetical protein